MPSEDGELLPPAPTELLDDLRRIEAREDMPDDVRDVVRVLRESAEARHVPPQGFAYGALTITGTTVGHAPPPAVPLQGEARIGVSMTGDLTKAVNSVKSRAVREYLLILTTGSAGAISFAWDLYGIYERFLM